MGFDGLLDEGARDFVGLAERKTLLDEIIGEVGGVEITFLGGGKHNGAIDGDSLKHWSDGNEAGLHGVDGVKESLFVLLEILVVGERETFHGGEKGDEVAIDATGFATDELGDVGIFLLGHNRGAGRESVV